MALPTPARSAGPTWVSGRIAADAGQWARCTTREGRKLLGIPSSKPSVRYLADSDSCICPDAQFHVLRDCKHVVVVRIHQTLAP